MLTRGRDDVPLVPVTVVAPQFRSLFPYQVFNAMQSQCFEAAYGSDQCMVVSSPTGSGKTVVLELALARLWSTSTDPATRPTAIYIAPLKALTHERLLDWRTKLSGLDIKCFELTGDTEDADFTEQAVRDADLIVTTPEKWGSTSNVQPWCQPLCPGDGLERRARPRAALRTPTHSRSGRGTASSPAQSLPCPAGHHPGGTPSRASAATRRAWSAASGCCCWTRSTCSTTRGAARRSRRWWRACARSARARTCAARRSPRCAPSRSRPRSAAFAHSAGPSLAHRPSPPLHRAPGVS